ncbi:MAG: hypothetical protein GY770_14885 [Aestuariibacter sp.]|nr:hypothetical protein [Aestuariibacter sp.]
MKSKNRFSSMLVAIVMCVSVNTVFTGKAIADVKADIESAVANGMSYADAVTNAIANGADPAGAVNAAINAGGDAGAVVTAATNAGGDAGAVTASAIAAGGDAGAVVTAATNAGGDAGAVTASAIAAGGDAGTVVIAATNAGGDVGAVVTSAINAGGDAGTMVTAATNAGDFASGQSLTVDSSDSFFDDITFDFDAVSNGLLFDFTLSDALNGGTTLFSSTFTVSGGQGYIDISTSLIPNSTVYALID